jgi:hypothetical protein
VIGLQFMTNRGRFVVNRAAITANWGRFAVNWAAITVN